MDCECTAVLTTTCEVFSISFSFFPKSLPSLCVCVSRLAPRTLWCRSLHSFPPEHERTPCAVPTSTLSQRCMYAFQARVSALISVFLFHENKQPHLLKAILVNHSLLRKRVYPPGFLPRGPSSNGAPESVFCTFSSVSLLFISRSVLLCVFENEKRTSWLPGAHFCGNSNSFQPCGEFTGMTAPHVQSTTCTPLRTSAAC